MPLTYHTAVRLIRGRGGIFTGHGREHDEFTMPWGTKVMVPRHRGDLSPGAKADIKRRARGPPRERCRHGLTPPRAAGRARVLLALLARTSVHTLIFPLPACARR